MRILFVCSENSDHGIASFILSQGKSLIKRGIKLDFFTIQSKGINGYLKGIIGLYKLLKKHSYDLIHAHYGLCGWVVVLANYFRSPVIVSYMGCDAYGDYNREGKKVLKSYINIIAAKLLQPFVDKIIVKSENLAKYIYIKKKCELISNGVNFTIFKPLDSTECKGKLGISKNKKNVLFLGNKNDPRKNFALAEKAVVFINNPLVEILSPYPVKPDNIPVYLNAVDVVILTSFNEGSPNVVKEAMACNCPIVATDVGDIKEVIGKTKGCYIADFDPKDLADKIKLAIEHGKPTTGRQDIAHLEESLIAEKLINLYQDVIKRKHHA